MNFSLKASPYLILSTLVFLYSMQRVTAYSILGASISPADIFLVFSVIFFLRNSNLYHLLISLLFCIFFIVLALKNNIFAVNAIITISLKIFLTLRFMVLFERNSPTKLDLKITYFYFFILYVFLFFFSENNPIFNFTIMNPNEGFNYLIVLWFIINVLHLKGQEFSSIKTSYNPILLGYFLFFIALFLFTRQGLLTILVFFCLYLIFNKNINFLKKIIYLFPLFILLSILIQYLQSLGEYETARINSVLSLEANTRSDQKRMDLIEFGINGFLNYPFGHGIGSFISNNEFDRVAHNFYVAVMYQLGIFGLIPVFYILLKATKNVYRSSKYSKYSKSRNLLLCINLIALMFYFQILFIGALGKAGIYVVSAWVLSNNNFLGTSTNLNKSENYKYA